MSSREAPRSGLMSLADAASYLGITVATLRWWLYSLRLLPYYKVGARGRGKPMLRQADLDAYLESRRVPAFTGAGGQAHEAGTQRKRTPQVRRTANSDAPGADDA